jgi:hypothetical protein
MLNVVPICRFDLTGRLSVLFWVRASRTSLEVAPILHCPADVDVSAPALHNITEAAATGGSAVGKVVVSMKSFLRTHLILLAALLVFGVASASAQVHDRLNFSTPFPFIAAGTELPAGSYSVAQVPGAPAILELTGVGGKHVVMMVDDASNPSAANRNEISDELVFKKLDNGTYALKSVWDEAVQSGLDVAWLNFYHASAAAEPTPQTIKR